MPGKKENKKFHAKSSDHQTKFERKKIPVVFDTKKILITLYNTLKKINDRSCYPPPKLDKNRQAMRRAGCLV